MVQIASGPENGPDSQKYGNWHRPPPCHHNHQSQPAHESTEKPVPEAFEERPKFRCPFAWKQSHHQPNTSETGGLASHGSLHRMAVFLRRQELCLWSFALRCAFLFLQIHLFTLKLIWKDNIQEFSSCLTSHWAWPGAGGRRRERSKCLFTESLWAPGLKFKVSVKQPCPQSLRIHLSPGSCNSPLPHSIHPRKAGLTLVHYAFFF